MAVFKGTTSDGQEMAKAQQAAEAPFLSAAWWKPKAKITFTVLETYKSSNGPYIAAKLLQPVKLTVSGKDGAYEEEFSVVRIGMLQVLGVAVFGITVWKGVHGFLPSMGLISGAAMAYVGKHFEGLYK